MTTSTVANGTNMIVNWDVAAREWGDIKETVNTTWLKLKANIG
jgi:hypothetical protein